MHRGLAVELVEDQPHHGLNLLVRVDRRSGFVASLAHHVDVGGGAPASIGAFREVFQEGIIIPPVKLVEQVSVDAGWFKDV